MRSQLRIAVLRGRSHHSSQCPQRVQDNRHIDGLLKQGSLEGWKISEGRQDHRGDGEAKSDDRALHGNASAAAGDCYGLPERPQLVDEKDNSGHFRR